MTCVSAIANEFLTLAEKSHKPISNMQLIKLLYIAQGFSLALLDKALFDDDSIQAWKYGPVVPSIYHEFKRFGSSPIDTKSIWASDKMGARYETPELRDKNKKTVVLITWQLYEKVPPEELIRLTHKPGTPWDVVYEEGANNVIPNYIIRAYYKEFVDKLKYNIKQRQLG